jgi:hypothetical protein
MNLGLAFHSSLLFEEVIVLLLKLSHLVLPEIDLVVHLSDVVCGIFEFGSQLREQVLVSLWKSFLICLIKRVFLVSFTFCACLMVLVRFVDIEHAHA